MIPTALEKRGPKLTFVRNRPVVVDAAGTRLSTQVKVLSDAITGSGTTVFAVSVLVDRKTYRVVVKRSPDPMQTTSERERQHRQRIWNGLQHERRVYELARRLVDAKITPFLITGVRMAETPLSSLVTTSDSPSNLMSMSKYIKTHRMSPKVAASTVAFLMYTIEVFERIGVRHNDLHLGNILMHRHRLGPGVCEIHYVPQSNLNSSKTYRLPHPAWTPKIFDFDRVFKRSVKEVRANLRDAMPTAPVMDRFGWHTPEIHKSDLNVTKVIQHLYDYARRYKQQKALKATTAPFALDKAQIGRLLRTPQCRGERLDVETWYHYYLAVCRANGDDRGEIDVSEVVGRRSAEEIFLELAALHDQSQTTKRVVLSLDMRRLYR